MADRSVRYKLIADLSGFSGPIKNAGESVKKLGADLTSLDESGSQMRAGLATVGDAAGKIALVSAAGMGAGIKAAMDWETAWTGVVKTVEGTPAELAKLEDGLRGIATETGFAHSEVAAVAEAAGQLGISTGGVEKFTKTMLDMGVSTNLTSEEAATGMARLRNIMGGTEDEIRNTGDAMVALGNNFATTEGEILAMSQRVAGAGRQAGLSTADVLGLSAAMSSVGIEAEAGGSAISTTMKRIGKEVETGGAQLDLFAKTAGMSASEFKAAWEADAAGALTEFVAGLGDAERTGMSTNAVLRKLGITGIREADSLLRLSSNAELLGEAFGKSNEAFRENNALAEESGKFYDTSSQKMKQAWAEMKNAAIDFGAVALPAVTAVMEGVAGLAQAVNDLPAPLKGATMGVGAFVTVAGGSLFVISKMVTGVAAAKLAMDQLGISAVLTGQKMTLARMGMLGAGGLVAGVSLLADESTSAGQAIETLGLTAGGALMGFAVGGPIGAAVGGGIGLVGGLTKNLWDATNAGRGLKGATDEMAAEEQQAKVEALAGSFDILAGSASKANRELVLSQLRELDKDMQAALQYVGISERTVVEALLGDEESIERINRKLGKALAQAEEFDPLGTMGLNAGLAEDALDKLGVSMRAVRVEVIKNKLATDDWAAAFPGIPKRVLTKLETEGIPESRGELKALVEQMDLTPKEIRSIFELFGYRVGKGEIKDLSGDLEALDKKDATPKVTVEADTTAAERARRLLDSLISKTITVTTVSRTVQGGRRNAHAEGGYITGPGTATSDSIPAYLSNGEYVIRAAAVQKYGVNMFDGLNAMRFAEGGRVATGGRGGVWSFDLSPAIAALTAAVDRQTEMLSEAEQARDAVLGKMDALAQATLAHFNTGLFDQAGGPVDPWMAGAKVTTASPLSNLAGDIAGLEQRALLQQQLADLGLTGSALDALLAQGSNADIAGMIARGEIDQYAALHKQREDLQASVGSTAGELAYGRELASITPVVEGLHDTVRELQKELARMEKRAEKRGADRVEQFAHVINTGASRNARQGVGKK